MMKVLLKQFFKQVILFCLFASVAYSQSIVVTGTVKKAATAAKQVIDLNVYSLYPSYEKLKYQV